jgi:hypothetical protein
LKNSFFNIPQLRPDFAAGVIPYPVRRAKSGKSGRQRFGNAKIAKAIGRQPIWKMGERRHFFNILIAVPRAAARDRSNGGWYAPAASGFPEPGSRARLLAGPPAPGASRGAGAASAAEAGLRHESSWEEEVRRNLSE